jgi:putative membrane protein
MNILLRWIISAIALYITVYLADKLGLGLRLAHGVLGAEAALIAVVALALVNAIIRPIVQLLTLPITCLTFGLFSFVINAFMFWLVGQLVPGFRVHGFVAPLFGSVVMAVISGALNTLLITDKEKTQ